MRTAIALSLVLVGCGNKAATGPGRQVEGKPVETRPPNASDQKPAFAGQTRAPYRTTGAFEARTVAKGLDHPWGLAFLDANTFLVTEKSGRLNILTRDGGKQVVTGTPEVDARDQGGLLDVVIDPDDKTIIYLTYAEPREGGNGTAVAKARLVRGDQPRLEEMKVIWRMTPTLDSKMHFGSRIVFAKDGTMFVTTGERSILPGRMQAQKLDSAFGKVIRINRDGSVPNDNPFVGKQGVLPEIYSYGHRNIQAAALHPETGKLWEVEHGAKGGDEVNIVEPGKDYGWPTITYGIEYQGGPIGEGITQKEGMEQPIYYWDPVIAPSGMAFYQGSLLVGGLAGKHIARLYLDGNRVVGEERLLAERARFRDVRVGPDNQIYALTDEDDGELLQLVPTDKANQVSVRPVR